jgi:hypothetical protein
MSNSLLKAMTRTGVTENGSISYSTTTNALLDYFSKVGTYTNRSQSDVDLDMLKIFGEDENLAPKLVFATRLITRKPNVDSLKAEDGTSEVSTGFGRKDEFFKAITWLHNNRPDVLYRNLHLIPVFGSWKDFVTEPLIDVLDREKVYELFAGNVQDNLLRKYLPQMRSGKSIRTERDRKRSGFAGGFAKYLGISPRHYRKLKSTGAAHVFQRQMSNNEWDKINFNEIPGRAMTHLVSRHGRDKKNPFERHNQVERLVEWVEKQNNVKFNGYPYELTKAASHNKKPSFVQKVVYNKQFENLLEKIGTTSLGNTLCALDTSGSMTCPVVNDVTALDICLSLGLVFSSLNVGYFKDHVVAFDNTSRLVKLKGNFVDKLHQIEKMETAWGGTNFQSVIDLLVNTRKRCPEIPLEEYPETLLVVSDMAMNIVGNNLETNYEATRRKLNEVGLSDMRLIWWYVTGRCSDFPAQIDDKGVYIIGGFDPVVLKTLMGLSGKENVKSLEERKEENPLDGMMNVLNQPIFNLIQ